MANPFRFTIGIGRRVSPEGAALAQRVREISWHHAHSLQLFGPKLAAISEINAVAVECAQAGWDGGEGEAMHAMTVERARRFVWAMPDSLPLPEIAPDPDGSISLDWRPAPHRMFVVSVGPGDRLPFAYFIGSDRGQGVARFDGSEIPSAILHGLCTVHRHELSAFRPSRTR